MLEQQLINAFMKFAAKAGAGVFIRDLVRQADENGNPKHWTPQEMDQALRFLHARTETFGKEEAMIIVKTLLRKFNINIAEMQSDPGIPEDTDREFSGVQGLQ